jgi:hypothetical protein
MGKKFYTFYPFEINSEYELYSSFANRNIIKLVKFKTKAGNKLVYVNDRSSELLVDNRRQKVYFLNTQTGKIGIARPTDDIHLNIYKREPMFETITFHIDLGNGSTSPPLSVQVFDEFESNPYPMLTSVANTKEYDIFVDPAHEYYPLGLKVNNKKVKFIGEGWSSLYTLYDTTKRTIVYYKLVNNSHYTNIQYHKSTVIDMLTIRECLDSTCVTYQCTHNHSTPTHISSYCQPSLNRSVPTQLTASCEPMEHFIRVRYGSKSTDIRTNSSIACSIYRSNLFIMYLDEHGLTRIDMHHLDYYHMTNKKVSTSTKIYDFDASRTVVLCALCKYAILVSTSAVHTVDTFNKLQHRVKMQSPIVDARCLSHGRILLESRGQLWLWDIAKEDHLLLLAAGSLADTKGPVQSQGFLMRSRDSQLHHWIDLHAELGVRLDRAAKQLHSGVAELNVSSHHKGLRGTSPWVFQLRFYSVFGQRGARSSLDLSCRVAGCAAELGLTPQPANLRSVEVSGALKPHVRIESPFAVHHLDAVGEVDVINSEMAIVRRPAQNETLLNIYLYGRPSSTMLKARGFCGPISRVRRTTNLGVCLCDFYGVKYLSWFDAAQKRTKQIPLQVDADSVSAIMIAKRKYVVALFQEARYIVRFFNVTFQRSNKHISHTANISRIKLLKDSRLGSASFARRVSRLGGHSSLRLPEVLRPGQPDLLFEAREVRAQAVPQQREPVRAGRLGPIPRPLVPGQPGLARQVRAADRTGPAGALHAHHEHELDSPRRAHRVFLHFQSLGGQASQTRLCAADGRDGRRFRGLRPPRHRLWLLRDEQAGHRHPQRRARSGRHLAP